MFVMSFNAALSIETFCGEVNCNLIFSHVCHKKMGRSHVYIDVTSHALIIMHEILPLKKIFFKVLSITKVNKNIA